MKIEVERKCEYRAEGSARRILPAGWRGDIPAKEARRLAKEGAVILLDARARGAKPAPKFDDGANGGPGGGKDGAE